MSVDMGQSQTQQAERDTVTDRERLDRALAELADRGYLIPFKPWEVDCRNCGWTKYREVLGLDSGEDIPKDRPTVWWHDAADVSAFVGDDTLPHTPEFLESLPDDPVEFRVWIDAHEEEAEADTIAARETMFATLRSMLAINWVGNAEEIAAALRAQGLRVYAPDSDSSCIAVLPDQTDLTAVAIGEDIGIQVGDFRAIVTVADAQRLSREIKAATKQARSLMMPQL